MQYKVAMSLAKEFINKFIDGDHAIVGSIRRKEASIGDVDIMTSEALVQVSNRFNDDVIDVRGGDQKLDVDYKGVRFNIYHAEPRYWGSMLFFLTGPRKYQIAYRAKAKSKGWTLNQYGLWDKDDKLIASKTENDIYKALDKQYKEPELRGQ